MVRQFIAVATAALTVPALTLALQSATDTLGSGHGSAAPTASTDSGQVRGVAARDAERFLGIPYAAPPVRDLRFAPPAEPDSWKGVRSADRQSPACPQFEPSGVREEQAVSEDCLYLDVYRPPGVARTAKLPVMVWFHGGANTQGTGVIYGGSTMAAKTGTIVVSVNYRLGALGFLAHPALSKVTEGGSGNYGRMDQLASLEWARDNIANFGGDPGNVTIHGQSAGGGAVCGLLAMPAAKGLFDKAVVQSSDCSGTSTTLDEGERSGTAFAKAVGCTDEAAVVSCLRKTWPGTLIAHQKDYVGGSKVGGSLLPKTFNQALKDGSWNKVPVMSGTTHSEFRLLATAQAGITAQGYADFVRTTWPDKADRALELYPVGRFKSPWDAVTQIQTDALRACPSYQHAQQLAGATESPVYRYEFNDPTSPTLYGFRVPGEDMANGHSAELAYLFDFTLGERPLTAQQEKLADQMMRYWAAFARTGDPNTSHAPRWPQFTDSDATRVMQLRAGGASKAITSFPADHHCDFWLG
ncbi:carboxylesterase family protein [Streptomyces sp. NPDC002790]|uniref:carboxylesterase/lipase family protein n=1 Tax=Streptomyces sp. NPDC002790 TaxID=3154431 RepID=UPI003329B434